MEIKNLVENTAERAAEKMDKNKERQKRIQNNRENVTDQKIEIGSAVTIKSTKNTRKTRTKIFRCLQGYEDL